MRSDAGPDRPGSAKQEMGRAMGGRFARRAARVQDNTSGARALIVGDDLVLTGEREAHLGAAQGDTVHFDQAGRGKWQPQAKGRRRPLPMKETNEERRVTPAKLEVEQHRAHPYSLNGEPTGRRHDRHVDRDGIACG